MQQKYLTALSFSHSCFSQSLTFHKATNSSVNHHISEYYGTSLILLSHFHENKEGGEGKRRLKETANTLAQINSPFLLVFPEIHYFLFLLCFHTPVTPAYIPLKVIRLWLLRLPAFLLRTFHDFASSGNLSVSPHCSVFTAEPPYPSTHLRQECHDLPHYRRYCILFLPSQGRRQYTILIFISFPLFSSQKQMVPFHSAARV